MNALLCCLSAVNKGNNNNVGRYYSSYSPICPLVLRLLRTPKAIDGRRQAKYKNSVVEINLGMV